MDRASLARLLEKYEALSALRLRREAIEASGSQRFEPDEAARRRQLFRSLAAEFPGCLRELDVRSGEAFSARAAALARALGSGQVERWMEVTSAYHATLREALAVKRWLSERMPRGGAVDAPCLEAFLAWHAAWPHAHGVLPEEDLARYLEAHLRPPGGRIHTLVWAALQMRFASTASDLEDLVFSQ